MTVPTQRIRILNRAPERGDGSYVLYWMTANRRTTWNYALDRAVEHAQRLGKPLLIFEPLRIGYRWASDRLHTFVIQGMVDNAAACAAAGITYFPYVEPIPDAGKGLLRALAKRACVVVADDWPCFFLPHLLNAGAQAVDVRMEAVDANGVLPLQAAGRSFSAAVHLRRFLQAKLPLYLRQFPHADPLLTLRGQPAAVLDAATVKRWPATTAAQLTGSAPFLAKLAIDHRVVAVATRGGAVAAQERWRTFQALSLAAYGEGRNHPDDDHASGLSPYLHFGHIGVHHIVHELLDQAGWSPERLSTRVNGAKDGWWGLDPSSEGFLDELITWRELGFIFCHFTPDYDRYESLPAWARASLELHAEDLREHRYDLDTLAAAGTHDPVWNAAQRQLVREGRMHNYLRMLWGKKILEWTAHPRQALEFLIELNNRYALDGRDPNSYSGIFWCLGRFDRAWGPERPIFGSIRYMTSANTVRKLRMKEYLARYG